MCLALPLLKLMILVHLEMTDGKEKEFNPKKKVHVDGEEVVNILEG